MTLVVTVHRGRHSYGASRALAEGWSYRLGYAEKKLDLSEGKLTVGRSRDCDISIQEPSISRKHVFLTVGSGKILLQDLGSSNGTFTNGGQVKGEAELQHGDLLRLGDAELEVEIESSEPKTVQTEPEDEPESSVLSSIPDDDETYSIDEPETLITGDEDPTSRVDFSEDDLNAIRPPKTGLWDKVTAAFETLVKRT